MRYWIKGFKYGTMTEEQYLWMAENMRYGTGSSEHLFRNKTKADYKLHSVHYTTGIPLHCYICGARFTTYQKSYYLPDERVTVCKDCFTEYLMEEPQDIYPEEDNGLDLEGLSEAVKKAIIEAIAEYTNESSRPKSKPKKTPKPKKLKESGLYILPDDIDDVIEPLDVPSKRGTAKVSQVKPLKHTKVFAKTMTYSPLTVEAMFRIIPQYSQYLKPQLISKLLRIIEAEGDIVIQHDLQETSQHVGRCRYTRDPALCITHTLPYTEQGYLVVDSAIVVKSWHWKVADIELQRSEVFVSVDGECLDHLCQHYYWLGAKVKH